MFACTEKKVTISIKNFEGITDQFNSSEPKLVRCTYAVVFFNKSNPCLILALFIKDKKKSINRWVGVKK